MLIRLLCADPELEYSSLNLTKDRNKGYKVRLV